MKHQLTYLRLENGKLYPELLFLDHKERKVEDQGYTVIDVTIENMDGFTVGDAIIRKPPYCPSLELPDELEDEFYLTKLEVQKRYRESDLGTLLLHRSKDIAKVNKKSLFLIPFSKDPKAMENEQLHEFYRQRGFEDFDSVYMIWRNKFGGIK